MKYFPKVEPVEAFMFRRHAIDEFAEEIGATSALVSYGDGITTVTFETNLGSVTVEHGDYATKNFERAWVVHDGKAFEERYEMAGEEY